MTRPDHEETIFTWGAPPLKFGAGRRRRDRVRPVRLRRPAGAGRHRPRGERARGAVADRGRAAPLRHRGRDLRRGARRADRRLDDQGRRVRPRAGRLGRVRRRRRRLGDRHRQGDQPADEPPRRADGLRQQAHRRRPDPTRAAQAAGRGADDGRNRLGVHRHVHARHPVDEGEDRHQPLAAAPDARGRRPAADDDACRRRSPRRPGWTSSATPSSPTPPAGTPTFDRKKPEERVTYCGANPVSDLWCEKAMSLHREVVPQRRAPRGGRRRGALGHDDGRDVRGHGLRQLRRAHPARERLPDRRDGPRTTGRRATRRTSRWCRTGSRCR